EFSMSCYNKAQYLHEGMQASVPPGYQAGRPSSTCSQGPDGSGRLVPSPSYYGPSQPNYSPPARSQYTYVKDQPAPAGQAPPPPERWSGTGWLRRANMYIDNRLAYALDMGQGAAPLYVTAAPGGADLEPYLNHRVNLLGPMMYRGDLRVYYLTATKVYPQP